MTLKYTCPGCGTPLGYEGLCWKGKCEQERQEDPNLREFLLEPESLRRIREAAMIDNGTLIRR